MRCIPALPFLLLAFTASATVNATTWDEIAKLEANKQALQHSGGEVSTRPASVFYRLSDGRQVNLRDWKIVLFMSSSCPHCHAFDPVLKAITKDTGFSVFPYTLDGRGDTSWPQAIPAPPMVITEFFAQGLPIATPTLFLVNVNNMKTYPLQQGESEREAFVARLDEVLRFAMDNGEAK
ncbi:type-F conjugative transfer system pilin assembly thiol-disulfide isomerase TrbB [Salmonella enterica]|nr:type-F conjugative transfer system pilin assembly thiol-disulfide isomerase TrbB [Salmonella enterica subsp. enterica serovar Chester]EKK2790641.1 type-F conjugative transfer system pilin assembly thiol-disulfide isomerase TrbB [Salmonella enterica]